MKSLSAALIVAGAALAFSAAAQAESDGEAVYNQACMACHMTGAAGAPIKGDAEAWEPRIAKASRRFMSTRSRGSMLCRPKAEA